MRKTNESNELTFLETAFRFSVLFLIITLGVMLISIINRASAGEMRDQSVEVSK